MPKRKRCEINVSLKRDICLYKEKHPKATQRDIVGWVATEHKIDIGRQTVSDILSNKDKWLKMDKRTDTVKRMKMGKHPQLEEALTLWLKDIVAHGAIVSTDILREKTKELGQQLGITDFQYSNGWIDRMKARGGIKQHVMHGESGSVDPQVESKGRSDVQAALVGYSLCNIFNFDETGLFFRLGPDRTLATAPVKGTKKCKDRLTVGLAANADGSEKLKPIVIGKSAKPRCFKGFDPAPIVTYKNNKKAWMVSTMFEEYVSQINRKMKLQGRKIVLLVDNNTSHKDQYWDHVRLVYLPPNTTSKLQPLDTGVIQAFKCHYRKIQAKDWIAQVEDRGAIEKTSVKDAIYFIRQAWNEVSEQTIANCFKHTGILPNSDETAPPPSASLPDTAELARVVAQLPIENTLTVDEYLVVDSGVPTGDMLSDADILDIVSVGKKDDDDSEDECDASPDEQEPPTAKIARQGLRDMVRYAETKPQDFGERDLLLLRDMLSRLNSAALRDNKQCTLDRYFSAK